MASCTEVSIHNHVNASGALSITVLLYELVLYFSRQKRSTILVCHGPMSGQGKFIPSNILEDGI